MKKFIALYILAALFLTTDAFAKGGFSSSGGRGGFSSSSSSRSYSAPSPSRSYSAPSRTVTSTTVNKTYYNGSSGGGSGYGYGSGLVQGMIIGNLMHPSGTTVYSGGGYNGQALLYPNGTVVDQNGMQVGTYVNGVFTPMQGGFVAQQAPSEGQSGWITFFEVIGLVIMIIIAAIVIISIL